LVKEGEEVERVFKKCFADASGEIVCTAEPIQGRPEWKPRQTLADILNSNLYALLENKYDLIQLRKKIGTLRQQAGL